MFYLTMVENLQFDNGWKFTFEISVGPVAVEDGPRSEVDQFDRVLSFFVFVHENVLVFYVSVDDACLVTPGNYLHHLENMNISWIYEIP